MFKAFRFLMEDEQHFCLSVKAVTSYLEIVSKSVCITQPSAVVCNAV